MSCSVAGLKARRCGCPSGEWGACLVQQRFGRRVSEIGMTVEPGAGEVAAWVPHAPDSSPSTRWRCSPSEEGHWLPASTTVRRRRHRASSRRPRPAYGQQRHALRSARPRRRRAPPSSARARPRIPRSSPASTGPLTGTFRRGGVGKCRGRPAQGDGVYLGVGVDQGNEGGRDECQPAGSPLSDDAKPGDRLKDCVPGGINARRSRDSLRARFLDACEESVHGRPARPSGHTWLGMHNLRSSNDRQMAHHMSSPPANRCCSDRRLRGFRLHRTDLVKSRGLADCFMRRDRPRLGVSASRAPRCPQCQGRVEDPYDQVVGGARRREAAGAAHRSCSSRQLTERHGRLARW